MKEMNTKTGVYTYNDEDILFNFTTDLTEVNKQAFVNTVVGLVVDNKHYNSILKDLVFDFCLVDTFTDIVTTNFWESKTFFNDIEDFLSATNIVDIIKANAEVGLIDELTHGVDLSIEYLTGIHKNPLGEALASLVTTLEKKVNEIDLESAMEMVSKFAGMTGELTPESVVNAYINSDMHQKNLDEIAEAKAE